MLEIMFWGFLLRFTQCFLQASPFILAGLFTAGVFHRLMGPGSVRKLFGGGSKRSLLQAWGVGMLLPVCSLGVIPVIRKMRWSGLAAGTILAFGMSAPLFNPLSLLYGLTLSEPFTILAFAFCSLIVVTIVGLIFDRLFREEVAGPTDYVEVPVGIKRITAVGVSAAREISGWSLFYIFIGLAGVALLGAFLPSTSLQTKMNYDNPVAPLTMTAIAIPVYATPMLAMSQLGMMFQHANSIGAAFALLALGAGMNLGLILWMSKNYGVKKSAAWLALLIAIVLGLAYGVEKPLFPKGVEPADHTHAFDIYCRPFEASSSASVPAMAMEKLNRDIQPYEWYSAYAFAALLLTGILLKIVDRFWVIEDWLEKKVVDDQEKKTMDIIIPAPVLGLIALVGLVAVSLVGCYAYYPPPDEALKEMNVVKGEALQAALVGDETHAKYWLEQLDDWSRKLQVGVYLRDGGLSDYHNIKARILREKLELLEHEVEEFSDLKKKYKTYQEQRENSDFREVEQEVRSMVADISRSMMRLRIAYLEER